MRKSRKIVFFFPSFSSSEATAPLGILAVATPLIQAGFEVVLIDSTITPNFKQRVLNEVRDALCAVNHVDNTGRLQTVSRQQNPRYYALIEEFERQTGLPIVLNTSFNEQEPIVCHPEDALNCFLRTKMDVLVLSGFFITRDNQA